MPPSPFDIPRIRIEVLARVAAGETVKGVCAGPGMPGPSTVHRWARENAPFGEELARAQRVGTFRRLYAYDEAKAAAFLARVRAGEPRRSLLGKPGMPSQHTFRDWCIRQAPFAEELHRLRQEQLAGHAERFRQARRDWDPALADRILGRVFRDGSLARVLNADPGLPCFHVVQRWRREQPEFDRALKRMFAAWRRRPRLGTERSRCTPALTERIAARIVEGASLADLGREAGMPARSTLYRWVAREPGFARAVWEASAHREDWYRDQMLAVLDRLGPASNRAIQRALAPLARRLGSLRRLPGRKAAQHPALRRRPEPLPTPED